MSKEKSTKPSKETREKEKRVDEGGKVKKDRKDKKEQKSKKEKLGSAVTKALSSQLEDLHDPQVAQVTTKNDSDNGDIEHDDEGALVALAEGALVPFANPLADEKQTKKLMKGVKKAAKYKAIRRGVKEVVKSIRKTSSSGPSSSGNLSPPCIVIIAADISPMDVISHLPVLCEDHNIPYIYVKSRAELGSAGSTKRPTSVVMLTDKTTSRKDKDQEEESEYAGAYADLVKLVQKAQTSVKI